jgi:uncharacterized protein (DUF1015 family)
VSNDTGAALGSHGQRQRHRAAPISRRPEPSNAASAFAPRRPLQRPGVPALIAVPRFTPFRGIRYARADLADVVAPPYDVLSASDRAALAARHPNNVVVVDVPTEDQGPSRYLDAGATLRRWLDDGVLTVDPEPTLYLYRLSFADAAGGAHDTVGVLGGLEVQENTPQADVLPHERTTPKATTDRLDLTRATGANLSPVWGLSLATGLHGLLADPATFLGEVIDDGVTHRLERIDDAERVAQIVAAVSGSPVVIADGHHRYDVARTFRREQRAANGDHPGPYDETLTFIAELVDHQLHVQAIHRLLHDIDGDLLAQLDRSFTRRPAGPVNEATLAALVDEGVLCLVHADGTGTYLVPRPEAFTGVRQLDSALLEHALDGFPVTVTYQHGVEHVLEAVTSGQAQFGILIRPVTVAAIEETAHRHLLMPPKSTFFLPKLKTGLVFRRAVPT